MEPPPPAAAEALFPIPFLPARFLQGFGTAGVV